MAASPPNQPDGTLLLPPTPPAASPQTVWQPPTPQPIPPTPYLQSPPAAPPLPPPAAESRSRGYLLRHGLIIGFLALGLLLTLGAIYLWDENVAAAPIAEAPTLPTPIPPTPPPALLHPDPVVAFAFWEDGRFGLTTTLGDPTRSDDDDKLLTFDFQGRTNNTRIYVDGATPLFGDSNGRFSQRPQFQDDKLNATWAYQSIQVQQTVQIVSSPSTRLFDTLRIEYQLENVGTTPREVGLRLMMDTLIGENDGVPFVVPGRSGIVDRAVTLTGDDIPDFIQALETADLVNPGVIVNLTLRGGEATPPDRVDLAGWYDWDAEWDIIASVGGVGTPLRRGGARSGEPDSAVGLYYQPVTLQPGESRTIVTFYGLGAISSTSSGNPSLSLTFARQVTVGNSFWVVAMVVNPVDGQTVRLNLPPGLSLSAGHTAEQDVVFNPDDHFTQISWLVTANETLENGRIEVILYPDEASEAQTITVVGRGVTR